MVRTDEISLNPRPALPQVRAEVELGIAQPGLSRLFEPDARLRRILPEASAPRQPCPQIELSGRIAGQGSQLQKVKALGRRGGLCTSGAAQRPAPIPQLPPLPRCPLELLLGMGSGGLPL